MSVGPGQTLLHYRIDEKICEGGMGVVWKAVDTTLDREVAIKVLPDGFAADPERLARFEREAKVLASLSQRFRALLDDTSADLDQQRRALAREGLAIAEPSQP